MTKLLMPLSLAALAGCADLFLDAPSPAMLELSADTLRIGEEEVAPLSFQLRDENGRLLLPPEVLWSAEDTTVLSVDAAGVVRGIGLGASAVIASGSGLADTVAVIVRRDWRSKSSRCRLRGDGLITCAQGSAIFGPPGTIESGGEIGQFGGTMCALAAGGIVHCRGSDYQGSLGDDVPVDTSYTSVTRVTFAPISGPGGYEELVVVHGGTFCGRRGGEVYCWGSDGYGRLGNDTLLVHAPAPVLVAGGHAFTSLARETESPRACGTAEGRVWCWGDFSSGVVHRVPRAITPDHGFVQASLGFNHACALTVDGEAYCWGYNHQGELGRGSIGAPYVYDSTPAPVITDLRFTDIVVLTGGTTCGVSMDAELWCWGNGSAGQLATAGTTQNPLPVRIPSIQRFASVHPRSTQMACALTVGGAEYCWGGLSVNLDTRPEDFLPRRTPSPY